MTDQLFQAPIGSPDGPTVHQLFALCEPEYRALGNEWRMFASKIRQKGGVYVQLWRFTTLDQNFRDLQIECLSAVVTLTQKDKRPEIAIKADTVMAAMLEQMLAEVPQWVPEGMANARR